MKDITILIADDEEEIADLIAIHLKKAGYHVMKASDGQETIHIIETQPIDLLILDIMMPKIDGYEVTRRIREKYNMPIIFLSAKTSDFDKVHGLVIGADDYMTKPFYNDTKKQDRQMGGNKLEYDYGKEKTLHTRAKS